ncbi:MAG: BON domain-containing protein [Chloroflexi bacterium]|nr:MAG: BON domain-containing protein [Chloroflexota bacterium]
MKLKTLLASIGLGAGLMYFFDPQHGDRRRAMVRDKANRFVNNIDESLDTAVEDARNRARGVLSEMTAKLSDQGAPDWILEERVRSNLGRMARHARAVTVTADGGRIYLSGPILREDEDAIVKTAMRTRGVYGVENQLQVVNNPQDIPALQGEPSLRRQLRPDWQQRNWSPATRLLSSVGGSLLTLYGLTRRGVAKPVLSTAGLVLTARGMTNLDTRSLLGLSMGENGIKANKAINILAPVDEVYRFWRNFENFPLFMNHVKEISVRDDVSAWKVTGPADSSYEFQSRITQDIPNELIAWETLPDSEVHSAGFVRFDENRDGSTRVSVQMSYVPPAGAVGHAVAQLFGVDPRQAMHEDLMRLKSLLEEGKTSTSERTVEYTETSDIE